jgi:hypothetical protein
LGGGDNLVHPSDKLEALSKAVVVGECVAALWPENESMNPVPPAPRGLTHPHPKRGAKLWSRCSFAWTQRLSNSRTSRHSLRQVVGQDVVACGWPMSETTTHLYSKTVDVGENVVTCGWRTRRPHATPLNSKFVVVGNTNDA